MKLLYFLASTLRSPNQECAVCPCSNSSSVLIKNTFVSCITSPEDTSDTENLSGKTLLPLELTFQQRTIFRLLLVYSLHPCTHTHTHSCKQSGQANVYMDSIKRWRRRLYFLILLGIKRGRVSPELQPTPRHLSSVLNVSHNEDVQQSHTKRGLNKYISKQSRLPHSSEGVGLDDGCGFCGNRGGWGGGVVVVDVMWSAASLPLERSAL